MLYLVLSYLSRRFSVIYRINSTRSFADKQIFDKIDFSKTIDEMALEKPQVTGEIFTKTKYSNYCSNNVALEVVGSGAYGTAKSVYLICGPFRYLFNCGEGTQRLSTENQIKLIKWPHIFITYPSWQNSSGLIGLALTAQSSGSLELCIHGHSCIEKMYTTSNKFVSLKRLKLNFKKCEAEESFSDEVIDVQYVRLYPSMSDNSDKNASKVLPPEPDQCSSRKAEWDSQSEEDVFEDMDYYENFDYYDANHITSGKKNESPTRPFEEKFALSFICQTKSSPGTLDIGKCIKMGLKPGPVLGKLKNGIDITLEDGTVVKSSDVTSPNISGATVIVVECPSENYLESLVKARAFRKYQNFRKPEPNEIPPVIIHFTSSQIVNNPRYQEWIRRFGEHTKHMYVNDSNNSLGLDSINQNQFKLNLLHPEIFPLLPHRETFFLPEKNEFLRGHVVVPGPSETSEEKKAEVKDEEDDEDSEAAALPKVKRYFKCVKNNHIKGESTCHLYLKPKRGYDYSYCLPTDKEAFLNEVYKKKNFVPEFQELKQELEQVENVANSNPQKYPKMLFLGTGSSQPNRKRNASGILLFLDEQNVMMLDCGEGTYGQMVRFFGNEKSRDIIRRLKIIYVSHMHADHHMGLVTLLKERKSALESVGASHQDPANSQKRMSPPKGSYKNHETLYLLAPLQMTKWLSLFENELDCRSGLFEFIPNSYLTDKVRLIDVREKCLKNANLKDVATTPVKHCPNAFGVAITHNDGWKLTYSGDTMPSPNLIYLGLNSDILIHEATMDDMLSEAAKLKLHSTMSEAVRVGMKMKAKYIVLTHFSQRYAQVPLFSKKPEREFGVAFDNMLVSFNQLPLLQKLNKAIKFLFADSYAKLQDKQELIAFKTRNVVPTNFKRSTKLPENTVNSLRN